jgi:putative Ca2+/H+ antiporter (TMEM165/GDT1 family)
MRLTLVFQQTPCRLSLKRPHGQLREVIVDAIIQSFLLVLASEMGDKTQLLAILLVCRFRKPWVIMGGILTATVLNHALAAWAGGWIASFLSAQALAWILASVFFLFAGWILIPDRDEKLKSSSRYGAFITTLVAFFLAEMGDKTQLATVALGAKFGNLALVTLGTTAGMMVADGFAVFLGEKLTRKISMKWIRIAASFLFAVFGIGILVGY